MRIIQSLVILSLSSFAVFAAEPSADPNVTAYSVQGSQPTLTINGVLSPSVLYLCGFSVRAVTTQASTNTVYTVQVAGLKTSGGGATSLYFVQYFPNVQNGVGVTEPPFTSCVPAANNTNIVITLSGVPTGAQMTMSAFAYTKTP
jgi:hypothetical protein